MLKKLLAGIAASIALLAISTPAFALTPEIVDNGLVAGSTTFTGTFTTVTTTMGDNGAYYDNGTSPIYFSTNVNDASDTTGWVRWTFAKPVTSIRVYYAYVESVDYSFVGSGMNDPESWSTSSGPVDLRNVADGGQVLNSGGEVITGQPEAALQADYANCESPNVTCSGYIDLSFPAGISWIEARNALAHAGSPGYNGVGLALDQQEIGAPPSTELAATGTNIAEPIFIAILAAVLGALLVSRRSRKA